MTLITNKGGKILRHELRSGLTMESNVLNVTLGKMVREGLIYRSDSHVWLTEEAKGWAEWQRPVKEPKELPPPPAPKPSPSIPMVARAIATQPNSVFDLGSRSLQKFSQ